MTRDKLLDQRDKASERELSYQSDLKNFKEELEAEAMTHENEILRLAKELEDEKQVPIRNICATLLYDLREAIGEGLISASRIWHVLPERNKLPQGLGSGKERGKSFRNTSSHSRSAPSRLAGKGTVTNPILRQNRGRPNRGSQPNDDNTRVGHCTLE